ncbi:MAG: hypothetical protein ACRDIF_05790 [Actinomycetota bacterium]
MGRREIAQEADLLVGEEAPGQLPRRDLLRKGLAVGGLGAAALWGTATGCGRAQEVPGKREALNLDVACLGDTFRVVAPEGAGFPDPKDPNKTFDARGATFSVEGAIYQAGTIKGDGFDPAASESARTGTWFCRGWFLFHSGRPEPHVLTTQEYVLGLITKDVLFPPDQLVSSGLEGAEGERLDSDRSVIGGTGKYAGEAGVVNQKGNGTNTTEIPGFGPAPNFKFAFRLK